jgi:cyanophycinase
MRPLLPLLPVLLALGGCGVPLPPAAAPDPLPRGHLFIVGGGPRPAELMQRFVELAGGPGQARVAVIPNASAEPEETGRELVEEMRRLGAEAFVLHLSRAEAEAGAAARLQGATGVWFSGGDQNRHTADLKDTPVEAALHALYRDGAVLGGTSAGAAVMSAIMITGDERRPGGDRPVEGEAWITLERDNVVTAAGFGFLPNAIVDQHFVRRRRHNRLLSLVLEHPELIGVGIDEATALEVAPSGEWSVHGHGTVIVYDARSARTTQPSARGVAAAGVQLHVLPAGSRFEPRTGTVTLPGRPSASLPPRGVADEAGSGGAGGTATDQAARPATRPAASRVARRFAWMSRPGMPGRDSQLAAMCRPSGTRIPCSASQERSQAGMRSRSTARGSAS